MRKSLRNRWKRLAWVGWAGLSLVMGSAGAAGSGPGVETGEQQSILELDFIEEIAYSPDGTRLAVAGRLGVVIWNLEQGTVERVLTGHTDRVHSVAWSPDGTQLASGSSDRTVRIWDVATGQPLRTLTGHIGPVRSVAWSPDGTRLASGSDDHTVRIWDATTGQLLRVLRGHTAGVRFVAWSPDGTQLVSRSADGTVRIWDAATGQPLRTQDYAKVLYLPVATHGNFPLLAEENNPIEEGNRTSVSGEDREGDGNDPGTWSPAGGGFCKDMGDQCVTSADGCTTCDHAWFCSFSHQVYWCHRRWCPDGSYECSGYTPFGCC